MPSPRPHVCFDRILPRELFPHRPSMPARGGRTRAISPIGKTWMNGSTLHVRFLSGGSAAQRTNAREQAGWWEEVANLKFVFDDAPDADIRISFDPGDGAGLAALLEQARDDPAMLERLTAACEARAPLFDPAHERATLRRIVRQTLEKTP